MSKQERGRIVFPPDEVLRGLVKKEIAARHKEPKAPVAELSGPGFLQAFAKSNHFNALYRTAIGTSLLGISWKEFSQFSRGDLLESIASWYFASLPEEPNYTVLSPGRTNQFYWLTERTPIEEDEQRKTPYLSRIYKADMLVASPSNTILSVLECKLNPQQKELRHQADMFFLQAARRQSIYNDPQFIVVTPTISKNARPPLLTAERVAHLMLPFDQNEFNVFDKMVSDVYRPSPDSATLRELQRWSRDPWW